MADRQPRSDAAEALLRAYRRVNTPTEDDRGRVWAALQARDVDRRPLIVWVAAAMLLAAIGLGWWLGAERHRASEHDSGRVDEAVDQRAPQPSTTAFESRRAASPSQVDAVPEAPLAPQSSDVPGRIETTRPSRVRATRSTASPVRSQDGLEAEMALIRAAERMLGDGDHERALALLERHAARFPDGKLALERDALRVLTLCKAGNRRQGRGEATILLRRDPDSPYRQRIRSACDEP